MSLTLDSLKLVNFRSYTEFALEDIGKLTILVGPNAIGKTNVIEAIQLVTAIQSFRNPRVEYLIREGNEFARIEAIFKDETRLLEMNLQLAEGKKKYVLNGKGKQAISLKGMCPAVIFTPDDLELVKGSNSVKRESLDSLGCQISENYRVIRRDFNTILKNKNSLLKNDGRVDLIEAINEVLITCSSQLTCYRAALFKRMESYISEAYAQISSSKEKMTCEYIPSWEEYGKHAVSFTRDDVRETMTQALWDVREQEMVRKRSLIGAHADKINFYIDGKDASCFASQGQQRSLVLALKIAEVAVIKDFLGTQPVLLLDDVMSELDEKRRACLVDFIEDEMQVFITTTNLGYFEEDLISRARVVKLGS